MTFEQLSRLRGGVYRLLGAGFSYPTSEMISAAGGATGVLADMGLFDFSFAPDLAAAADQLSSSELGELSIAYVALFEAGVTGAVCSPYESAFRSDPRTGGVASLHSQLKRSILRFGLKLEAGSSDAVDHVATEMHVMTMLCRREAEMRAEGKPTETVLAHQGEFLDHHVLAWVPSLAERVHQIDRHSAYTALGAATRSFLAHEKQLVPLLAESDDLES